MSYGRNHSNISSFLPFFKHSDKKDADSLEDYHLLYPDEKIIIKEYPADKIKHQKTYHDFKRQFVTLCKAIDKWGIENKCTTIQFQDNIRHLQIILFQDGFASNQKPFYFKHIKANLEMIWFQLHKNNLSLAKRKNTYKNLCANLTTCAPGLYIHIENSLLLLTRENSVEWWLADLRTHLVEFYADRYNSLLEVKEGNSIHTHIAFWNEAAKNGWNIHFRSREIVDPFKAHVGIEKEDLQAFRDYFEQEYTRYAISECIKTNLEEKFNSLVSKYGLEKTSDWIPYHYPLIDEFDIFLKELGITQFHFEHIYHTMDEGLRIKLKLTDITQTLLVCTQELIEKIPCVELYEMSQNNILMVMQILQTPSLLQKTSCFTIAKMGRDHLDAAMFILKNPYLSTKLMSFEYRMIAETHSDAAMYCLQDACLRKHFKSFDLIVLAKKHQEVAMLILSSPALQNRAGRYFLSSIALKNPEAAMTILSSTQLVKQLYSHEIISIARSNLATAKYIFNTPALLSQLSDRECNQIMYKYPCLHEPPSKKRTAWGYG